MSSAIINKIIKRASEQIEFINPNASWMLSDLRNMKVTFRTKGADMNTLLKNKDKMIKQVWKLGKAHELLHKGLLRKDGSLSKGAFEYLKKQKEGKIPSGIFPGEVYIELAIFQSKK